MSISSTLLRRNHNYFETSKVIRMYLSMISDRRSTFLRFTSFAVFFLIVTETLHFCKLKILLLSNISKKGNVEEGAFRLSQIHGVAWEVMRKKQEVMRKKKECNLMNNSHCRFSLRSNDGENDLIFEQKKIEDDA